MKKYLKKVINILTNIIIVILVLCLLANSQSLLFGKKYNNIFGYTLLEIKTASMEGTMDIGDWILVKVTDDVKLNDVITYESDDSLITHRIIEIYGDKYITKGDSNNTKDLPISKSQIVGKVIKVMPKFGIIKKTILNEKVLLILALIFLVACSLVDDKNKTSFIFKFNFNKNKKKTKKEKELDLDVSDDELENIKMVLADENPDNYSRTTALSKITVDIGNSNFKKIVGDDDLKKAMESTSNDEIEMIDVSSENNDEMVVEKSIDEISTIEVSSTENENNNEEIETENQNNKDNESETTENNVEENPEVDDDDDESNSKIESEENNDSKDENQDDIDIDDVNTNDSAKRSDLIIGQKEKNLVYKGIELKKHHLFDMFKIIFDNDDISGKLKTTINRSIDKYIEIKYLYQNEYVNLSNRDYIKTVGNKLNEYFDDLLDESSNNMELVDGVRNAFSIVNLLDNNKVNVRRIINNSLIEFPNKDDVCFKLETLINNYVKVYSDYFDKIVNDKFVLSVKKVCNLNENLDLYNTNISSNIKFSQLFSDLIIEKSYKKDVILEDIREVQLKLISIRILSEMINNNYNKRYIINFPNSLFDKSKKTISILNTIDDNYSQNKVYILISLDTLKCHYELLEELKHRGYHFVIELNKSNIRLIDNIKQLLLVVDYVFISNGDLSRSDKKEFIPSALYKNVISVDKSLFNEVVIK